MEYLNQVNYYYGVQVFIRAFHSEECDHFQSSLISVSVLFFASNIYLELRLFKAYMNLPYHVYMQRNSSDLLRNITQEVTIITNQLMIPMIAFFSDLITVLFILIMLLTIEPTITIITFFTLGLSTYLFIWFTSKKMKKYGALAQDYRSEKIKAVNEGLGAFKDAFILQKQQYFVDKLKKQFT
jgi:ABC-type multidrug transport system fused ATPase/permease subunit